MFLIIEIDRSQNLVCIFETYFEPTSDLLPLLFSMFSYVGINLKPQSMNVMEYGVRFEDKRAQSKLWINPKTELPKY